jgi:hypothetical protein
VRTIAEALHHSMPALNKEHTVHMQSAFKHSLRVAVQRDRSNEAERDAFDAGEDAVRCGTRLWSPSTDASRASPVIPWTWNPGFWMDEPIARSTVELDGVVRLCSAQRRGSRLVDWDVVGSPAQTQTWGAACIGEQRCEPVVDANALHAHTAQTTVRTLLCFRLC